MILTAITVHSFKGGTGKSLIVTTLAYYYSLKGEKTLIIDGDYTAPCLETYFPKDKSLESIKPFTSFLEGKIAFEDTIAKTEYKNLYISYSPPPSFSEEVLKANSAKHGEYLKKMMEAIEIAYSDKLKFDKIIFDSTNGVNIPAINHLACSQKSIVVIKPTRYGIESTHKLVEKIYSKLAYLSKGGRRSDYFIWNQVPNLSENSKLENFINDWTQKLEKINLKHLTTISYSPKVVLSMIVDLPINLPEIYDEIKVEIEDIASKLEKN